MRPLNGCKLYIIFLFNLDIHIHIIFAFVEDNDFIFLRFHEYELVENPHVRIYGAGPISYVTVTPLDQGRYGIYRCIATNKLGAAEHIIQFRQAFAPAAVVQVSNGLKYFFTFRNSLMKIFVLEIRQPFILN